MNKVLLMFYSLSVFFSRGKKELVLNGTWFLLYMTVLYNFVTLLLLLFSQINFKLNKLWSIGIVFIFGALIQLGLKKNVLKKIQSLKIREKYNTSDKKRLNSFLGLLIIVISFFMIFIVA